MTRVLVVGDMGNFSELQRELLQESDIQIVQAPLLVETFGRKPFEFVWWDGAAEVGVPDDKPKNTPHGPQRKGKGGKIRKY
jgi:hypothetical protein